MIQSLSFHAHLANRPLPCGESSDLTFPLAIGHHLKMSEGQRPISGPARHRARLTS